ncbi:MAG: trimethylamine methyltransferase family protein, partial [Alphaproteobacteria bacterium]
MSQATPEIVDVVTVAGGRVGDDGRLLFPATLVERALDGLPRDLVLHARNSAQDLPLGDGRVHVGTGGAAPLIVDLETGAYRPSELIDLHDAARLVDTLDHVHFVSRPLVARDMPDPVTLDLNTAYACLAGTTKHVMTSASVPDSVTALAELG